jgi:hypothetical protein
VTSWERRAARLPFPNSMELTGAAAAWRRINHLHGSTVNRQLR